MRKISLFLLALLTGSLLQAQNLPSYVPSNGLVGWWPFNGNANDESGNGNNGTVNGATLTADRFGNAGAAYNFNGSGNYIRIPDENSSGLDLTNNYTMSVWANLNGFGSPPYMITKHLGNLNNLGTYTFLLIGDPPNLILSQQATPHFDASVYSNAPANFQLNTWYYFACTYENANQRLIYYVNGIAVDTVNTNFQIQNTNIDVLFGAQFEWDMSNISAFWNGQLDDIAIYNRALTQQEITALYQGANTSANCLTLPSNLQQGLVGYWPFCGNALDESGNGNHGTVNGATLTTDRFGNAGSAYQFNGTNYISVPHPDSISFDSTHNFSIGFWQKKSDQTVDWRVMLSYACPNGNGYGGYQLGLTNNLSFELGTTSNEIFTGGEIQDEAWNQITLVVDRLSDSAKVFQNGIFVGKQGMLPNHTYTPTCAPDLLFGGERNYWTQYYYRGSLDDIAIWNRALNQQEITQLYNQGICQTSITVTDTLLIHTGITGYNPVAYGNTLKLWPNPGNQAITLDAGNLGSMAGWKFKVANTLGQIVVNETAISQQQTQINLSSWGGNGIYYLHLINPQGHAIEIKKIVLAP